MRESQTYGTNRAPPKNLLDHGVNVWKERPITKLWKSATQDLIQLCLSLLLHIGIEAHCQDERVHSGNSLEITSKNR